MSATLSMHGIQVAEMMLSEALSYAERGFPVFPVHTIRDGICSCENKECQSPGKHPMIRDNLKVGTTNKGQVEEWWSRWPDANIGLVTGKDANIFVLDLDLRNGGDKTLSELEDRYGPIGDTLISLTGGGGKHFFFVYPNFRVKSSPGILGNGLDVKGDGGYVVLPPSIHHSGNVYRWKNRDTSISQAPTWLLERLQGMKGGGRSERSRSPLPGRKVPEGQRNSAVFHYALKLHNEGVERSQAEEMVLSMAQNCQPPLPGDEALRCLDSAWRYEPASPTLHRTDLGNAQRLVRYWGEDIRYCHHWKTWFVWTGDRWAVDETGSIQGLAKDTVRRIYAEATEATGEIERKTLAAHGILSESERSIRAMISLAQSEPGVPIVPSQLDADPMLFNILTGTINLRTGGLMPHSRANFITKIAPVAFDAQARCPLWETFLDRIMCGNPHLIEFLKRAVGYSLTGRIHEQCLFFMYGTGANGKSTFLEALRWVFGDYFCQADFSTFLLKSNDAVRNDLARLKGARFVAAVEASEGRRFDEAVVKQVTGGDMIVARRLYSEFFEFVPEFKIWFAANHRPQIRGTEHAIWRRIHLIPFTVTIPEPDRDVGLVEKLKGESSGILNWALEGCTLWQKEGLGVPSEVRAATRDYRDEMDVIGPFIAEELETNPGYACQAKVLYQQYKTWCEKRGEEPKSMRAFGTRLKEKGFATERGAKGYMHWKSVRIREG